MRTILTDAMGVLADLIMFGRFAKGLGEFLAWPLSPSQAEAMTRCGLAEREANFLRLIERGIFGYAPSPYRALLREAGCELGDVIKMVRASGLESALRTLERAGVYVSFEEFKGRRPLVRGGREIPVRPEDFHNPLLVRHFEGRTGGSRSAGSPVFLDLDLAAHGAAWHLQVLNAFNVWDRPMAVWRPLPPGVAGLQNVLRHVKVGQSVQRWFSQNRALWNKDSWKHLLLTLYAVYGSRWWGRPLPAPEYLPLEHAERVAGWLAEKKRDGTPALLDTNASSGVRVCRAALERGLDIRGSVFRLGGEPYTPAKADVVAAAGCRAFCHYAMSEVGLIGIACAAPMAVDEVHLLSDKLAVIERPTPVGSAGLTVPALTLTTIHPACPLLLLNVVSDDYGVMLERNCGCPLHKAGLRLHLHTIRSYEKLNSEGMTFFGSDLFPVIEEVLPRRFGGAPTDYQFVETEENGLPRVNILVSPRVGPVDDAAVVAVVLQALRTCPDGIMMAQRWQAGGTLRVLRRPAYTTAAAKTLPLHIVSK